MASPTVYSAKTVVKLGDPDDPIVRVAQQVSSTGTTIVVTDPGIVDKDGTKLTPNVWLSIRYGSGEYKNYVEIVKVTAIATDKKTLTVVRGIDPSGDDFDTGTASLAKIIPQDSIVEMAFIPQYMEQINNVITGSIATGGTALKLGDETDSDIYIYAYNADTNKPFIEYDKTNNKWIFSNDGVSSTDVGGGTGTITAGDGIDIAAGVVSTDLATNGGLEISSTELKVKSAEDTAGYLTGGSNATTVVATWTAVSDGEFTISIDGVSYDVTGIDFSTGVTDMDGVASKIETALRAATSGTETVILDTDHFLITSGTTGANSQVSVTSAVSGGGGTDISGVGATPFMDCETAVGTPTRGTSTGIDIGASGVSIDKDNVQIGEAVAVTATSTEINQALDGIGSDVTAANLDTLTDGSNADALHAHNQTKILARMAAITTVTNDTTLTTLCTYTLPGNTLTATNLIRARIVVSDLDIDEGDTINFYLTYGATSIGNHSYTSSSGDADNKVGDINYTLGYNGATNSQRITCLANIQGTMDGDFNTPMDGVGIRFFTSTAAQDSTTDLEVALKIQWAAANSHNTITIQEAYIELLQ